MISNGAESHSVLLVSIENKLYILDPAEGEELKLLTKDNLEEYDFHPEVAKCSIARIRFGGFDVCIPQLVVIVFVFYMVIVFACVTGRYTDVTRS